MKTTKYQVTVNARTANYLVYVVNDKEHDLVVFERIGHPNGWKREIVVPFSDKCVMISGDSTGVIIKGLKEDIRIFSVGCNEVGDLVYSGTDLFEEPIQTNSTESISLEDTLKNDPVLLNGVAAVFAEKLNEASFTKKLDAIKAIVKTVSDGLLINPNIAKSLDIPMSIAMKVERAATDYIRSFSINDDEKVLKYVINYCVSMVPTNVLSLLEIQNVTPKDIAHSQKMKLEEVEWFMWFVRTSEQLAPTNDKEKEIIKPNASDKLPLLNAMIARIHDKQSVGRIVDDLNISTSIVTTVMCACGSIKLITISTDSIFVLIDYIVKNRIVDSLKKSVEQNYTVEQVARLESISIYEADWLVWFVKTDKANKSK